MNETERTWFIIFSFLLMGIGLFIGFAMPYPITSEYSYSDPFTGRYETISTTMTVYGHPFGFVLDGIGFMMLLYAMFTKPVEAVSETEEKSGQVELAKFMEETKSKGMNCGTCLYFGNPIMCPFKERNPRSQYCVYYKSKTTGA